MTSATMTPLSPLLLLLTLTFCGSGRVHGSCPCDDSNLCRPIVNSSVVPQREVFMFSVAGTTRSQYELYDWDKITTLTLTKYTDDQLVCYGHSKNTKVVLMVSYPGAQLLNASMRQSWIVSVNNTVHGHFMDGVHLDFEDFILPDQESKRNALYILFTTLYKTLKRTNPHLQVTIDFDSDPTTPYHAYGYADLMSVADFAFLRTYDQRRWVLPPQPCFAWATDANNVTIQGLLNYEKLGIPAHKLVVGFAWFGYDYPCTALTQSNVCSVALYEGRCTVVKAHNPTYADIVETLIPLSAGGQKRDNITGAPFINYKNESSGTWRQVWYNDPVSLTSRYRLAGQYGLRGVGAWILRDLDYRDTPVGKKIRKTMFDALPQWKQF